jgi:hypothetical protein
MYIFPPPRHKQANSGRATRQQPTMAAPPHQRQWCYATFYLLLALLFSLDQVASNLPIELQHKLTDARNDHEQRAADGAADTKDKEQTPPQHQTGFSEEYLDMFSHCNCPANDPNYDASQNTTPTAKMAYLISVHNKRTIHDGAYLLKALMETSHPGNTAIILIHVDKRVGIASRADKLDAQDEKNKYLYDDSVLKRYVDACLATPACTGNNSKDSDATILEVHSHFSPEWSKWSMNDPTIWGLEYLVHHSKFNHHSSQQKRPWDVFINLSGDTLPVITGQRISQLFEPNDGPLGNTNFVTSASCVTGLLPTSIYHFPKHWMKRAHYFQKEIPKTLSYIDETGEWREDVEIPIYFGSQWMALTYDFVSHVVRSMDHPNGLGNVLKETLIDTEVLMTDETFFATILMNSPEFKDTLPKLNADGALERYPSLFSLRYERMDENNPGPWGKFRSSDPLMDIPPRFADHTDGEGAAKPWGPYFLGVYDLGAIRDSGALFIRKVSWTVDENLIVMLPIEKSGTEEEAKLEWDMLPDLRWPEFGVKVRDPFVWDWENAKLEKQDHRKEKE